MKDEIKVIKLMQQEASKVNSLHSEIGSDLDAIKAQLLKAFEDGSYLDENVSLPESKANSQFIVKKPFVEIVDIANVAIPNEVGFRDILSDGDLIKIDSKVNAYIEQGSIWIPRSF